MSRAVRQWAEQLPDEFLICRDTGIGHDFSIPVTADRVPGGFEETLRCSHCGSLKKRFLDRLGRPRATKTGRSKKGNSYGYVEGYLRPSGSGRMSADENAAVRLVGLKRRYQL